MITDSRELPSLDERALFNMIAKDATKDQLFECLNSQYSGENNRSKYRLIREDAARKLDCGVKEADKLVGYSEPKRSSAAHEQSVTGKTLQGSAVLCPVTAPWPEPVDGATALNQVSERFAIYLAVPRWIADLLALWAAHTHCFDYFVATPRLHVTSPVKGCGKTTCRDVLALFVHKPLPLDNITVATGFRLVDRYTPTILGDEADRWLTGDKTELIGFINSGHRKGGVYPRCEGDTHEPRLFRAHAPAALFSIGHLPDTVYDRSIVLRLHKAKPGEVARDFDPDDVEIEHQLCSKLSRWIADNKGALKKCPELPPGVLNRLKQKWIPLFSLAELAGGSWVKRCVEGFSRIVLAATECEGETIGTVLLADTREVIEDSEKEVGEWLPSGDMVQWLLEMPHRDWANAGYRGKQINEHWIGRKLSTFGLEPKVMPRGQGWPKRGYQVSALREAFERYLPPRPVVSATVQQGAILPSVALVAHADVACATPFNEGKTGFVAHNHLQQDVYPCFNGDRQTTPTERPKPVRPAALTPHGDNGTPPAKTAFIRAGEDDAEPF